MRELKEVIGTLLAAGYSLDDVLDLSFDHIALSAQCIIMHKAKMVNMVIEPLATGLTGVKIGKNGKVRKRTKGVKTQSTLKRTGASPETRDKMLLSQLGNLGFDVK